MVGGLMAAARGSVFQGYNTWQQLDQAIGGADDANWLKVSGIAAGMVTAAIFTYSALKLVYDLMTKPENRMANFKDLKREIAEKDIEAFKTRLEIDLAEEDPDNVVTSSPYNSGQAPA